MEQFTSFLLGLSFTSQMGLWLYWVPLILCLIGYIKKTWLNYRKDVVEKDRCQTQGGTYFPTDCVADVVGRVCASIIPGVNIIALVFDVLPGLFSGLVTYLDFILNKPLVPRRK